MIFGSVCSGIEAATVAWTPLGWRAAWYAEIEPFPSRVLAARHPGTPNLGDMTKLHDTEVFRESTLDVLVGGTPCQSFSVAGLRKGLADPRGNLALVFLGLIDRARPRWVVWENVPGVLSSWSDAPDSEAPADDAGGNRDLFGGPLGPDGGGSGGRGDGAVTVDQTNDFDTFTRGLSELGYGVAWAVLDAQYFGVPQRRQRVFVVAHLGAAAPAEAVLFDRYCLCGHPAPSREAGTGAAPEISNCITARGGSGRCDPTAEVLLPVTHTLRGEGHDASEDGTGRGTPIVPVAYDRYNDTISEIAPVVAAANTGRVNCVLQPATPVDMTNGRIGEDDVAGTLEAGQGVHTTGHQGDRVVGEGDVHPALSAQGGNNGGGDGALTHVGDAVRRLTPRECEHLQGFPDDYTLIPGGNRSDEEDYAETVDYLMASGYSAAEAMALADTPDGPRYKALGNSMAVPVMAWIGARIAAVDSVVHPPKKSKKKPIWP